MTTLTTVTTVTCLGPCVLYRQCHFVLLNKFVGASSATGRLTVVSDGMVELFTPEVIMSQLCHLVLIGFQFLFILISPLSYLPKKPLLAKVTYSAVMLPAVLRCALYVPR